MTNKNETKKQEQNFKVKEFKCFIASWTNNKKVKKNTENTSIHLFLNPESLKNQFWNIFKFFLSKRFHICQCK